MQVNIDDAGNLRFNFKSKKADVVTVYKLLDAGEVEFVDNECVGLELLNFDRQINRPQINNVELCDAEVKDDVFIFHINVDGQLVNGKINFASLKDKI